MAILKSQTAEMEVAEGESMAHAAKKLGVNFGCQKGVCGACVVIVLDGMENLSPKSESEESYDLRDGDRMMCQCQATGGSVSIQV
jgi:ferredoxin